MNRGDVVLVDLPSSGSSGGHEQGGTRPALIVHSNDTSSTLSVIMIVPFTSRSNASKFPHTIPIQPSSINGLDCPSILLVFQLRAIDKRRIIKTIGHLEAQFMSLVDGEIKNLLSL